jgi:hypothetical protein
VSRDSIRIAILIAALSDLDILAANVQNAYLNAPTKARLYTITGPEFGPAKVGRPVLIVQALYGLRSSGAHFHDRMAATLCKGGCTACKADADVWMKAAVKKDGMPYYKDVLCYCDNILAISEVPKAIMEFPKTKYTLKNGSNVEPRVDLGAKVSKHYIAELAEPDEPCWSLSAQDYMKRAKLDKAGKILPTKVSTPCTTDYRPERDQSKELVKHRRILYFWVGVRGFAYIDRHDRGTTVQALNDGCPFRRADKCLLQYSEGVVKNMTAPESPLKKKHVAICSHRCRDAQAAGFVQITKEHPTMNLADALTKPLSGERRRERLQGVLW